MISSVNHIGIAVKNLDEAIETFGKLFPIQEIHREEVTGQKVRVASFMVGNLMLEFLQATTPDSAIAKFIEKKGEGIHHIAFTTDNAQLEIENAKAQGMTVLDESPRPGAHHADVAFVHPASTHRVLVEFCQPQTTTP